MLLRHDIMIHVRCYLYFTTFLHKPSPSVSPTYAVGRPVSSEMMSYFRYGEEIFFASICGRTDVVCFTNMASHILNDQWYADRDRGINIESERIGSAPAQLIKAR